ncbi:UNVERIFIED_CONTAM: hypothetical protein GTU68_048511 [Idotea baltica]|nr:hypothetical protein [Idotea baltica]
MAGETLDKFDLTNANPRRVAVKEAVFPFGRFPGVDPQLGPEMRSTGEVMGWDDDFGSAFLKSQMGGGTKLPDGGTVFISVKDRDKPGVIDAARHLQEMGFAILATGGTARQLIEAGLTVSEVNKVADGQPHIVDAMINGQVQLVFNTTEGAASLADSASIRRTAVNRRIPYFTTLSASIASVQAIASMKTKEITVRALQSV